MSNAEDREKYAEKLQEVLSAERVNTVGRNCRQSERLRKVTPFRLMVALIVALGARKVESIADLLREFNFLHPESVAYKAFWNRLAQEGFPQFVRSVFRQMMQRLIVQTLEPRPESPLNEFDDIVIQDGSSFALKDILQDVFPGRFTEIKPAAVELHATYSGFADQMIDVSLTPDKEPERDELPADRDLDGKLLLADRGYPSVDGFYDLDDAGACYVMRLSRIYKPYVRAIWRDGVRHPIAGSVQLKEFLAQTPEACFDLEVEFGSDERDGRFRLVVVPGKEHPVILATNLPRDPYEVELVEKLYRFRWQVELNFKEWKSYANLHAFNTGNPEIAEGLVWASLCAGLFKRFVAHATEQVRSTPISTRRVAMSGPYFVERICRRLDSGFERLVDAFGRAFDYLEENAARAHPERDRKTGRLRIGLRPRAP